MRILECYLDRFRYARKLVIECIDTRHMPGIRLNCVYLIWEDLMEKIKCEVSYRKLDIIQSDANLFINPGNSDIFYILDRQDNVHLYTYPAFIDLDDRVDVLMRYNAPDFED